MAYQWTLFEKYSRPKFFVIFLLQSLKRVSHGFKLAMSEELSPTDTLALLKKKNILFVFICILTHRFYCVVYSVNYSHIYNYFFCRQPDNFHSQLSRNSIILCCIKRKYSGIYMYLCIIIIVLYYMYMYLWMCQGLFPVSFLKYWKHSG